MIRKQLLSSRIQNTARDADLDEAPILESAGQVGQLIEWRMGSRVLCRSSDDDGNPSPGWRTAFGSLPFRVGNDRVIF